MNVSLIIVGAGKGERFGKPKAELLLAGRPLIEHTLEAVKDLEWITQVLFVGEGQHEGVKTIAGGHTRAQSVQNGLSAATEELVMIHNVANPLATQEDFEALYEELKKGRCAAYVGQPVVDTLRLMEQQAPCREAPRRFSTETIDRNGLWRVQTPQGFYRGDLMKAVGDAMNRVSTDDIQLFEGTDTPIRAIKTSPMNSKITFSEDLEIMEQYFRTETRVGIGEDSHAFDLPRRDAPRRVSTLTLGGLILSNHPKLTANSDGDVILHALFNAISSALGKGSLGTTADPMCEKGITDSKEYLKVILKEMSVEGYRLNNVSISLECAHPRIEPIVPELKKSLSQILDVNQEKIGITAHSGDALSAFGRGEGIRCLTCVSLGKAKDLLIKI